MARVGLAPAGVGQLVVALALGGQLLLERRGAGGGSANLGRLLVELGGDGVVAGDLGLVPRLRLRRALVGAPLLGLQGLELALAFAHLVGDVFQLALDVSELARTAARPWPGRFAPGRDRARPTAAGPVDDRSAIRARAAPGRAEGWRAPRRSAVRRRASRGDRHARNRAGRPSRTASTAGSWYRRAGSPTSRCRRQSAQLAVSSVVLAIPSSEGTRESNQPSQEMPAQRRTRQVCHAHGRSTLSRTGPGLYAVTSVIPSGAACAEASLVGDHHWV